MLELRPCHAGLAARQHPMSQRLDWRIALLLTVPPMMWAGNAVVGRLLVGQVEPLTLNALRWLLALVLLLPLGWRALRHPHELWQRRWYLAALALTGVGMYNSLQYLALHTSTPLNVTLIAASLPVWMLGVGYLVWRVRPRRGQFVGAALSLGGVALVLSRGDLSALAAVRLVPGDLWMLAATLAWALYSWLLARPPLSMQGEARPAWNWSESLVVQIAFGVVFAGAAAGIETAVVGDPLKWSGTVAAAIVFIAVGPSIAAYYCWGRGVAAAGPATAAFFVNLTPVFTGMLSALLLGLPPRWYHLGAFVLIAAGIVVTSRTGRTDAPPPGRPARQPGATADGQNVPG